MDRRQVELASDEVFGGLFVEPEHRATAVVVEVDVAALIVVDHLLRRRGVATAEVQPFGKDHEVGGEAVAADVRALPHVVLARMLAQLAGERPAERRAARIVATIRAHQDERVGCGLPIAVAVERDGRRRIGRRVQRGDPPAPAPPPIGCCARVDEVHLQGVLRRAIEVPANGDDPNVGGLQSLPPARRRVTGELGVGDSVATPGPTDLDQQPAADL